MLIIGGADRLNAEIGGDVESLRQGAAAHEANRDRIKTWQGEVDVEDTTEINSTVVRHSQSIVTFAYDESQSATRWSWTYRSIVAVENGEERPVATPISHAAMLKNEVLYRVGPTRPGEPRRAVMKCTDATPDVGAFSDDFDPFFWFTDFGVPLDESLRSYYAHARNLRNCHVTRDGAKFTLYRSLGQISNERVVDLSVGGNLVRWLNVSPGHEQEWTFEYAEHASIWLPKRTAIVMDSAGKVTKRTLAWRKNVINEPLPATTFAPEVLSVAAPTVIDIDAGKPTRVD